MKDRRATAKPLSIKGRRAGGGLPAGTQGGGWTSSGDSGPKEIRTRPHLQREASPTVKVSSQRTGRLSTASYQTKRVASQRTLPDLTTSCCLPTRSGRKKTAFNTPEPEGRHRGEVRVKSGHHGRPRGRPAGAVLSQRAGSAASGRESAGTGVAVALPRAGLESCWWYPSRLPFYLGWQDSRQFLFV